MFMEASVRIRLLIPAFLLGIAGTFLATGPATAADRGTSTVAAESSAALATGGPVHPQIWGYIADYPNLYYCQKYGFAGVMSGEYRDYYCRPLPEPWRGWYALYVDFN